MKIERFEDLPCEIDSNIMLFHLKDTDIDSFALVNLGGVFHRVKIWKEARELCKRIFEITSITPFCTDFKLRDQIKSSSGSIMDNIASPVK